MPSFLSRRWLRPLDGYRRLRIDPSHWAAKDLKFAWIANNWDRELVTGTPMVFVGTGAKIHMVGSGGHGPIKWYSSWAPERSPSIALHAGTGAAWGGLITAERCWEITIDHVKGHTSGSSFMGNGSAYPRGQWTIDVGDGTSSEPNGNFMSYDGGYRVYHYGMTQHRFSRRGSSRASTYNRASFGYGMKLDEDNPTGSGAGGSGTSYVTKAYIGTDGSNVSDCDNFYEFYWQYQMSDEQLKALSLNPTQFLIEDTHRVYSLPTSAAAASSGAALLPGWFLRNRAARRRYPGPGGVELDL